MDIAIQLKNDVHKDRLCNYGYPYGYHAVSVTGHLGFVLVFFCSNIAKYSICDEKHLNHFRESGRQIVF